MNRVLFLAYHRFKLDAPQAYYTAKNNLLNTRVVDLLSSFDQSNLHFTILFSRQSLYLNREISVEDGQDAKLLLKYP